jgi:UDP-2,3-diacylglucosamine pyrophosphatase LpxH
MLPDIKIYPLGDVHLGSPGCQFDAFRELVEQIASEPRSYAVMMGDLLDMGLKNSVGDPYHATMPPGAQKRAMVDALMPIKGKILALVSGNHEGAFCATRAYARPTI